ncbi:MAG: hypothetical protein QS748_00165 [Candidatus Endonucleobacter bathymodioli]|uniref:Uncharacterized protein n=1 Tax=Candidatus Endonucleibacter bathymodioli TaxID=539814 RepID=A0AA90SC72_9GAMM|nr:hypothetical protein [Candidatus Endonucleobacter bathymodioli]
MNRVRFCTAILAVIFSGISMFSLAGLSPGLQTSMNTGHPFMLLEATGITTLAFIAKNIAEESSDKRDVRLMVGRVVAEDDSTSAPFVSLSEHEKDDNKNMLENFAWLNYNQKVDKPYFAFDAFFVKNIGLSHAIEEHAGDGWREIYASVGGREPSFEEEIIEDKVITVGELFKAACESESGAIQKLEEVFSLSSEEAYNTLESSKTPIKCSVSLVRLKNTTGDYTGGVDFNRYNITIQVGKKIECGNLVEGGATRDPSMHWYDIGMNITVAAPKCEIIYGRSGWAIDSTPFGEIRSNTGIKGVNKRISRSAGMEIFARLALIGWRHGCASYDERHMAFGSKIDTEDAGSNRSLLFGSLSDNENEHAYVQIKSTEDEVPNMAPQMLERCTGLSDKVIEQVLDVIMTRASPVAGAASVSHDENNLGALLYEFFMTTESK